MSHVLHTPSSSGFIYRFFSGIWNGLIRVGERSAHARLAQEINNMSDQQLEAAGLTRADFVKRVMTDGYHI
ncbi:MAG: hypothetical protein ABJL99_19390 [Aliishimia sp.]